MQDLLREREQLKSELAGQVSTPLEEGRPRKARSLASPSSDLMSISNQPALGNCQDPSTERLLGVGAGGCVMWRMVSVGSGLARPKFRDLPHRIAVRHKSIR